MSVYLPPCVLGPRSTDPSTSDVTEPSPPPEPPPVVDSPRMSAEVREFIRLHGSGERLTLLRPHWLTPDRLEKIRRLVERRLGDGDPTRNR